MELDCGDSSCLFAKNKTGMRTNGGCCCIDVHLPELNTRSHMIALKYLLPKYLELKRELEESEKESRFLAEMSLKCRCGLWEQE